MGAFPTLFVLVGLPGAGKTTAARLLAHEHRALRFTPDEWMIPLFGQPEADRKRDVLEGRLITVSLGALRLGVSAVLDFGCWTRHERLALRWLAEQVGVAFESVYLEVDRVTQLMRVAQRWEQTPECTFTLTPDDLDRFRTQFEVPEDDELHGFPAGAGRPPPPWDSWGAWAKDRWPSLAVSGEAARTGGAGVEG